MIKIFKGGIKLKMLVQDIQESDKIPRRKVWIYLNFDCSIHYKNHIMFFKLKFKKISKTFLNAPLAISSIAIDVFEFFCRLFY